MQKWLISADSEKWNHSAYFAECGFIDWKKRNNYEIGDIVYIYSKKPTARIIFKTFVEDMSSNNNTDDDWVIFRLIEYKNSEDLSLENLRKHGLKNPPQGSMRVNGELEEYIDNCFSDDVEIRHNTNKLWFINAGENSLKLNTFLKHDFIGIGKPVRDLTGKTREEIKVICEESDLDTSSCLYKLDAFANQIKFADYIITKDTINNEYYIGRCISDYYYSDKKDDSDDEIPYYHCRDVVWLNVKMKRENFSKECLKFIDYPKSVQEIKDDNTIKEILNFYNFNFLSHEKRNLIYFGAPGTGKSYLLNQHVNDFLKMYVDSIEENYERVTFHPDYTFSNFVGTYKPVPKERLIYTPVPQGDSIDYKQVIEDAITYKFVPGPFMRTLVKALKNPYEPFILVIEEINRANMAAVFGDIFQLLDRDELFNSEYPINASEDIKKYIMNELNFSNIPEYRFHTLKNHLDKLFGKKFEKIAIPSNMFIWATMNSADQGVFQMDTAFKRRWDFEYLGIDDGVSDKLKNLKVVLNGEEIYWNRLRTAINKKLLSFGVNEDKLMGPFFAFHEFIETGIIPEDEFRDVFKNKIIMYLFEDAARSRREVLFNVDGKENLIYSDIRNAFDGEKGIRIFSDDVTDEIFKEK